MAGAASIWPSSGASRRAPSHAPSLQPVNLGPWPAVLEVRRHLRPQHLKEPVDLPEEPLAGISVRTLLEGKEDGTAGISALE